MNSCKVKENDSTSKIWVHFSPNTAPSNILQEGKQESNSIVDPNSKMYISTLIRLNFVRKERDTILTLFGFFGEISDFYFPSSMLHIPYCYIQYTKSSSAMAAMSAINLSIANLEPLGVRTLQFVDRLPIQDVELKNRISNLVHRITKIQSATEKLVFSIKKTQCL